jgi:ribonuclease HI
MQVESSPILINPLDYYTYNIHLELIEKVNKKEQTLNELKQITLATIEERFPTTDWLHIYTDGSVMKNSDSARAGVHSSLLSYYIAVGQFKSNLDTEVEAIRFALEQLIYRQQKFNNVVLLVDSQATIRSIASSDGPASKNIQEIRKLVKLLGRLGKKIHIQWILSHVDL